MSIRLLAFLRVFDVTHLSPCIQDTFATGRHIVVFNFLSLFKHSAYNIVEQPGRVEFIATQDAIWSMAMYIKFERKVLKLLRA